MKSLYGAKRRATLNVGLLCLLLGDLDLALVDLVDDVVGGLLLHRAADTLARAQDLLHGARQLDGTGPLVGPHRARQFDDGLHGEVARVLDVLHLLPVSRWLLQRLPEKNTQFTLDGTKLM